MSTQKNKIHGYYNLKIAMLLTISLLVFRIGILYGQPQKIFMIYRYDDFSSLSPTDFEIELINLYKKFHIPFTVGIIPYVVERDWLDPAPQKNIPLNEEKASILRKAILENTIEPALHGYSHQTIRKNPLIPSEFSGASYEEQVMKIKEGKAFLENALNQKINIFIPPWNSSDEITLRCLEEIGINCISSNLAGAFAKSSKLYFIPYTTKFSGIRRAISSARRSSCPFPVIVFYFHEYEFKDVDSNLSTSFSLDEFYNLLSWISSQDDIEITSMRNIIKEYELGAMRFNRNKTYHKLHYLLPPFIIHVFRLNTGVYFSESYLLKTKTKAQALFFGYILFVFSIIGSFSFITGKFIFARFHAIKLIALTISIIMVILSIFFILKDQSISQRGFALILGSLALFLGVFISFVSSKTGTP